MKLRLGPLLVLSGILTATVLASPEPQGSVEPLGSGNAWIRVIPTLSSPSCKNGEKLTINALVRANAGAASVEAAIVRSPGQAGDGGTQPVARLRLRPAAARVAGILANGTVGLWQADWTASGLTDGYYRVELRVEDHAGHVFTDSSLAFSDPTAGFTTIGTTSYPTYGMTRDRAITLEVALNEKNVRGAVVVDSANGYAYFGTSTVPGYIVKIDLATFTRVGAITLNAGENYVRSAVLDTTGNAAFFGCDVDPTIIVKVNLATFTRSSALTLNAGESNARCVALDTANRMAYFGMNTVAGKIVKVNLETFARVGVLTLNAGEDELRFAVIDTAPNPDRLYVGTDTTVGRVIKIRLDTFARESALTLNAGEDGAYSAALDTTGNALFVGTNISPGIVVKINLATFTRSGATTLNAGENLLQTAVGDATSRMAYFPTGSTPGNVVKYNMATSARVGAIALNSGENNPYTCAIDTSRGAIYLGTYTNPAIVTRVLYGQKGKAKLTKFTMSEPGSVTKFSFYSHTATGNVRIGLYREDSATLRTLVWESGSTANSQTGGYVDVLVGAGTPTSLTIDPGTYHFAWQIDNTSQVPSYTAGSDGDGSYVVQSYGAFPATLDDDGGATSWTTTSEKWTGYITYTPVYTLTYTAGANGSIDGTTPQTVESGGDGTAVEAVPDANYHFVNWSDASTENPRTDTNVTGNISVTANFALDVISVTVTPDTWALGERTLDAVIESGTFTIENDGNIAEDFEIRGTDGAGGWSLESSAAENAFRVDVDRNDDGGYDLILSTSDQALFDDVAVDATRSVGLKYTAPSGDTVGAGTAQDFTVTIKASKHVP